MRQDDKLDARIKAALQRQPLQTVSPDFASRLRVAAERIAPSGLSGETIHHLPALQVLTRVQAMAGVALFIAGLTFGTSHSPFTNTASTTTQLDLYSFYNYSTGGIL